MSERRVLVVSPDERWLRVLEVTLRLGGYVPLARRSVVEALRIRADDTPAVAVVLDLGPDSTVNEVDAVREVLGASELRAVVVLPERLASQADRFRATGATVIVRPYPPSALYTALDGAGVQTAGASTAQGTASPSDR